MKRLLPLTLLMSGCGGSDALLLHYTVNIHITAPDWVGEDDALVIPLPPCPNAEVFDQTLRVYDGMVTDPVTAVTFVYGGIDLSNGGENKKTVLLASGESTKVYAALEPDLVLYEFNHKGQLKQLDGNIAPVSGKSEAEVNYSLGVGDGLAIIENHVLSDTVDEVLFLEEGAWNCDITY
jgi:hypothetical protein